MKKLLLLIVVLFGGSSLWAQDFEAGEKMFNSNCKACHSIGGGKLVGPDLKGVSERRKEDWLLEFIKTPGKMIEKDAEAKKLFEEYNRMPMPDHTFLSDAEIKYAGFY
jgi:mono/diheme cytochrome c family protein